MSSAAAVEDKVSQTSERSDVKENAVVEDPPADINFTAHEESRLRRKFDLCLLPPLVIIYLFNSLDKSGIGNAKTSGWDKAIGLTGNQYYILVMVFYVPFCLSGTPIALLVKRYSAARVLPIMMVGFGSMSLFTGIAKSFSALFAIRWFLGIFESAMLPGTVFYLSTFYKRGELASRIGLFYAAASISGAFSGLIAYGVFKNLAHEKHLPAAYLFWIEGAATVFFAIVAFLWLPRSAQTWWMLTEREKEIASRRTLADSSTKINEKLNITEAFSAFKNPMYWVWALANIGFGVPLASVNNFLPQIVTSLGYTTVQTNLLTVAPNIVGTVALVLLTFSSDYFRERSFHICIALATGIVGFVVLGAINPLEQRKVAYFACFLLCMGAFAPSVLMAAWYSNNTIRENQRVVVAAVMVALANSAGLISTNVFRAKDEPKYVPALATSAAFGGLCLVVVLSMGIWMRRENARRNREQGVNWKAEDVETRFLSEGPQNPGFRYMY